MGWTDYGPDYTQSSTITAGTLNAYNRDNLEYLKAHHDATSGVHMQASGTHVIGHDSANVLILGKVTAEQTVTTGEYDLQIVWGSTFSQVLAVIHSMEYISGSFSYSDECVRSVTNTGCYWHIRTWNNSGTCKVKGHVIVVGVL